MDRPRDILSRKLFAHAATVRSTPGQSFWLGALSMLHALLYPMSGLYAGVRAISSAAVFGKTPLRTAARARVLLMVVKEDKIADIPKTLPSPEENQEADVELGPVKAAGASHGHLEVEQANAAQSVSLPDTFTNLTGRPMTEHRGNRFMVASPYRQDGSWLPFHVMRPSSMSTPKLSLRFVSVFEDSSCLEM
jgi:hypothetical protein